MSNIFQRMLGLREDSRVGHGAHPVHDSGRRDGAGHSGHDKPRGANWEGNVVTPAGIRSLMVPTWYRCVTLIMQTMGQLVVQYRKRSFDGGNFIEDIGVLNSNTNMRREHYGRKLNYLLQIRPNPFMTASQMQEQIEFRKIYYGNAYVYIEKDVYGDVLFLWLCTSGTYLPESDSYFLTYNKPGLLGVCVTAPSSDVLHFKNTIMCGDMTYGLPTIQFAMKALQISATGDDQALQDMAKGGKYKIIIQEEKSPTLGTRGRANQQELKKVTDRFQADLASNDAVMLDNVADMKIISQTAQQLQLLEQRGYSAEDICRLMGVPKVMAMIGDGGSYKMPEHATQEFLLRRIQPIIRNHEDEYNAKLVGCDEFCRRQIHLCEKPLRRLDARGQAEIDRMHLETGWSVNELRVQYDLPSIPSGDAHYVSTNLAEVGSEKLRGGGVSDPDIVPVISDVNSGDGDGDVLK